MVAQKLSVLALVSVLTYINRAPFAKSAEYSVIIILL